MTKYLGEMEEEDLILFVLEHLKDHKAPHKLVEGLEPVRTLSVSRLTPFDEVTNRFWKKKLLNTWSASGGRSYSKVWHTTKASSRRRCSSMIREKQ
jgi:hypothetical protein